jgi:hypothetical protein
MGYIVYIVHVQNFIPKHFLVSAKMYDVSVRLEIVTLNIQILYLYIRT